MSLSNAEVLSIALGLVLGGFALIGLGIVAFFIYQHHRQRADISTALLSDEEEEAAARQPDDADPWEVNILPDVVTLLKSCKLLSYRLMSTVLEEAGQSDHELVTGSMDAIVAASRPIGARANDVTESMYHPVDRTRLLTSATALVKCIDDLVCATRENCDAERLPWLDELAVVILRDFRRLCINVDHWFNVGTAMHAGTHSPTRGHVSLSREEPTIMESTAY